MKKYFCEEDVFGYVWENCDRDGLWDGDAANGELINSR